MGTFQYVGSLYDAGPIHSYGVEAAVEFFHGLGGDRQVVLDHLDVGSEVSRVVVPAMAVSTSSCAYRKPIASRIGSSGAPLISPIAPHDLRAPEVLVGVRVDTPGSQESSHIADLWR